MEVLRWEAVTWPDGSLGCAQEGMAYITAEVPGFQITLTSTRDVVTVHTDEEGRVALVPRDCW